MKFIICKLINGRDEDKEFVYYIIIKDYHIDSYIAEFLNLSLEEYQNILKKYNGFDVNESGYKV